MAAGIFAGYVTDLVWSPGSGAQEPCHAEYKFMDRKAFQLCSPRDSIPTGYLIFADLYGNGQHQVVAATAEGYIAVFDRTSQPPVHAFQDNRLGSILFLTSTKFGGFFTTPLAHGPPWPAANAMKRVRTWASGPFTLGSNGDTQNCLFCRGFSDEICCCYDLQQYSMPGESLLKVTDFATAVPVLDPAAPAVPLRFVLNAAAVGGPLALRPTAQGLEFDPAP